MGEVVTDSPSEYILEPVLKIEKNMSGWWKFYQQKIVALCCIISLT
jgi:hypothetical protein